MYVHWVQYNLEECTKNGHTKQSSNLDFPIKIIVFTLIFRLHYNDVIMTAIASQITSLTIVYSIVYSDANQRKHQSSASLAFVRGIHQGPVNSPHKWPAMRKMIWLRHHEEWHLVIYQMTTKTTHHHRSMKSPPNGYMTKKYCYNHCCVKAPKWRNNDVIIVSYVHWDYVVLCVILTVLAVLVGKRRWNSGNSPKNGVIQFRVFINPDLPWVMWLQRVEAWRRHTANYILQYFVLTLSQRSQAPIRLTRLPLVPHIYVNELGQHWLR